MFLRRPLNAWVVQTLGAFSVDREATDPHAMKEAMATLVRGRHALTAVLEQAVQAGVDALNAANPHPGGDCITDDAGQVRLPLREG